MKRPLDEDAIVESLQKRCREAIAPIFCKRKTASSNEEQDSKRARRQIIMADDTVAAAGELKTEATDDDDAFEAGVAKGRQEATEEIMQHLRPIIDDVTREAVRKLNDKYDQLFEDLCRSLGFTASSPVYVW